MHYIYSMCFVVLVVVGVSKPFGWFFTKVAGLVLVYLVPFTVARSKRLAQVRVLRKAAGALFCLFAIATMLIK